MFMRQKMDRNLSFHAEITGACLRAQKEKEKRL